MGYVMNRYIDVNEFYNKMYEWVMMHGGITRNEMQAILEGVPSIDIVKCAECKYKQQCHKAIEHTTCDWTSVTIAYRPIEFCSYGEREGE